MVTDATERALLLVAETLAAGDGDAGQLSLAAIPNDVVAGEMPPLHVHDSPEAFHVAEGNLTLHVGDRIVRLAAGERFVAPAGVPHTHVADSPRARFVTAAYVRSAGRYADFLCAVARPGPLGESAAGLAAIGAANGITLLGPPGAVPAAPPEAQRRAV